MFRRIVAGLVLVGWLMAALPVGTAAAQGDGEFPAARPGYPVGVRTVSLADELRPDRRLTAEVWDPAMSDETRPGTVEAPQRDAEVWFANGPYPLLVISHGNGGMRTALAFLAAHLAARGFVVAAPDHLDAELGVDQVLIERVPIDRPLDLLAVIDGLPGTRLLGGMIDAERVGVIGYSLGGFTALTLSGARIDPAAYLAACARPEHANDRVCMYAPTWAATEAYRAELGLETPSNEAWPPYGDGRIQAVLAIAPSRALLFGADGLAAAEAPGLIVGGTADELAPYATEAVFMADHLGSEPVLISALEAGHYDLADPALWGDAIEYLGAAWFRLHLRGRSEDAALLEPEVIDTLPGLAWGAVMD